MKRLISMAAGLGLLAAVALEAQTPVAQAAADQLPTHALAMGVRRPVVVMQVPAPAENAAAPEAAAAPAEKPAESSIPWKVRSGPKPAEKPAALSTREIMVLMAWDWETLRRVTASDLYNLGAQYAEKLLDHCASLAPKRVRGSLWNEVLRQMNGELVELVHSLQLRESRSGRVAYEPSCKCRHCGVPGCTPACIMERLSRRCVQCHQAYGGPLRSF